MGIEDETRANEFDRLMGRLQTENVILHGVGKSILDIGCGIGEYIPLFLDRFIRVVGLDPSEKYLNKARKDNPKVEFIQGFGESFETEEKFDNISMTALLEHVDDPVNLLMHVKRLLTSKGQIIIHVPNSETVARELGVLMGIIPSVKHISQKEALYFGHQRVYNLKSLETDCQEAGLQIIESGGILYKPLPNVDLWKLYQEKGEPFIKALIEFGRRRPEECSSLYAICR